MKTPEHKWAGCSWIYGCTGSPSWLERDPGAKQWKGLPDSLGFLKFCRASGEHLNQPSLTYAVPSQVVWWLGNMCTWIDWLSYSGFSPLPVSSEEGHREIPGVFGRWKESSSHFVAHMWLLICGLTSLAWCCSGPAAALAPPGPTPAPLAPHPDVFV